MIIFKQYELTSELFVKGILVTHADVKSEGEDANGSKYVVCDLYNLSQEIDPILIQTDASFVYEGDNKDIPFTLEVEGE